MLGHLFRAITNSVLFNHAQSVNDGFDGDDHACIDSKVEMAPLLTLEDVAEYLRVHPSTICRLLKKKHLPAFKVGRDWRFNREEIGRWRVGAESSHQ